MNKKIITLIVVFTMNFIRTFSLPIGETFDWRKVNFINGIGEPSEDDSYLIDVYGKLNNEREMLFRCIVYSNYISIEVKEVIEGEPEPYFVGYNDLRISFKNEREEELAFRAFACTTGLLICDDIKGPKKYKRIDDLLKRSHRVDISIHNDNGDIYGFQVECDDYKED